MSVGSSGGLRARSEGTNLVVLGHWDALILTPAWLREHVAQGQIVVDVPDHARLPPRLRFDGVTLLTIEGRLILGRDTLDEEGLAPAEAVALKLLKLLPHTPVTGTGVNFQWTLPRTGRVEDVLHPADTAAMSASGAEITQTVVRRRLTLAGHTLNVTLESDPEAGARLSINHHQDTRSAAAASKVLEDNTSDLQAAARGLAEKWYGA